MPRRKEKNKVIGVDDDWFNENFERQIIKNESIINNSEILRRFSTEDLERKE